MGPGIPSESSPVSMKEPESRLRLGGGVAVVASCEESSSEDISPSRPKTAGAVRLPKVCEYIDLPEERPAERGPNMEVAAWRGVLASSSVLSDVRRVLVFFRRSRFNKFFLILEWRSLKLLLRADSAYSILILICLTNSELACTDPRSSMISVPNASIISSASV